MTTNNYDMLALRKRGLIVMTIAIIINALLSDGYAIHHVDRDRGKCGGGIALICKKSLKLKHSNTVS